MDSSDTGGSQRDGESNRLDPWAKLQIDLAGRQSGQRVNHPFHPPITVSLPQWGAHPPHPIRVTLITQIVSISLLPSPLQLAVHFLY